MITENQVKEIGKGVIRKVLIKSTNGILAKGKNVGLEKINTCYVRFGINYANMKSTIAYLQANGLTQPNELSWGKWVDFPYFIEHKGQKFIRLSFAKLPNLKSTSKYYINGVEQNENDLIANKMISDKKHTNDSGVITIPFENLIKIFNVAE